MRCVICSNHMHDNVMRLNVVAAPLCVEHWAVWRNDPDVNDRAHQQRCLDEELRLLQNCAQGGKIDYREGQNELQRILGARAAMAREHTAFVKNWIALHLAEHKLSSARDEALYQQALREGLNAPASLTAATATIFRDLVPAKGTK